MDTSEIYTKQCDCPEVQEACAKQMKGYSPTHGLWKPTQDMIQEMLGRTDLAFCIYQLENGWGGEIYQDREQVFSVEADSPEQVWLSFYMLEKHKKIWDGEKWHSD